MAAHRSVGLILLFCLSGCTDFDAPEETVAAPVQTSLATQFERASTVNVQGHVRWSGELPQVPPLDIKVNPFGGPALRQRHDRANPNAPLIDAGSRGVAEAVVFLRGIDPARARPWDHPPVRIEQAGCRFQVRQGEQPVRFGIARRGDPLEMVALDDYYYALHADGAAFFTLSFPEPRQPRRRIMAQPGVVEFSSGVGYYWMRGYVVVGEHPYYTRTDGQGAFLLPEVPPGRYELVCWLPNWHLQRHERDPESGVVCRQYFAPPIEQVQTIEVGPSGSTSCEILLNASLFAQPEKQNGNNRL